MTIRTGGNIIAGGFTEELLQTKANLNLDNSTAITNCITEIPQDIKLELSSGTLTLKAGSKVYVPNGSGVFNTVTTSSDITVTKNSDTPCFVFYRNNTLFIWEVSGATSGTTAPSGAGTWYDTANNNIKRYVSGSMTVDGLSLPIAIVGFSGNTISSIDQVFNGFGYIGSTWFLLPNVKFNVTWKRNDDGSYKTYIITNPSIKTLTRTSGALSNWVICTSIVDYEVYDIHYERDCYIVNNLPTSGLTYTSYFNMQDGKQYYTSSGTTPTATVAARIKLVENCSCDSSGKITASGKFLLPFTGALSINDSSTISGWAMPSSRYIDLTLGASNTDYQAPANGYVFLQKSSTASEQSVELYNRNEDNTANITHVHSVATASGQYPAVLLPVKKGNYYRASYSAAGTSTLFRFIYVEGDQ